MGACNIPQWSDSRNAGMQAGPPYALDPWSLDTLRGSPDLLDGLLIDGIAPSTTGSDFLDQVTSAAALKIFVHLLRLVPLLMHVISCSGTSSFTMYVGRTEPEKMHQHCTCLHDKLLER